MRTPPTIEQLETKGARDVREFLHEAGRDQRSRVRGGRRRGDRHGFDQSAAGTPPAAAPARAVAPRRIALALYRESVKETGLSRTTVLKDLLNGETLAQIDGSKAQAVESAVMARITTRLNKAVAAGKITQTQATALGSAATAGISKLMDLNLSTYIRVRFGRLAKTPSVSTLPTSTTS